MLYSTIVYYDKPQYIMVFVFQLSSIGACASINEDKQNFSSFLNR